MTATVTALIELALEHGFGVAFLIIGAQVVLDRLMPVEHLAALLFGGRKSAPGRHAQRRELAPRDRWADRLTSGLGPEKCRNLP